MSTSRLEKFVYAICSMEVSDLPAPLSRIEILWNCLITGESPDFEPQSRNEKYLMAMLGLYELENLPSPMSRGEKLLYKIAMGETDLSDVPGYLSRYEELLKYLIENGVLSDFEYVLYALNQSLSTLYTTVEKPVKSAILKGQTLVNLFKNKVTHRDTGKFIYVEEGDKIQATFKDGVTNGWIGFSFKENVPFEIGKTYTVMNELYKCDDQLSTFNISLGNKTFLNTNPVIGINKLKITIPTDYTEGINWMYYNVSNTNNSTTIFSSNLLIFEGDYTQEDIPYFEGMQSVKMPVLTTTGKNLFDVSKATYGYITSNGSINNTKSNVKSDFILVKGNTSYRVNAVDSEVTRSYFSWFDNNKIFISRTAGQTQISPSNAKYLIVHNNYFPTSTDTNDLTTVKLMVTEGDTLENYEPYKSTTLTLNEPVTLRKVGDVRDTLDCLTGEVVERVGEVVFDGDTTKNTYEAWTTIINPSDGYEGVYVIIPNIKPRENKLGMIYSALPEVQRNGITGVDKECVVKGENYIGIVLKANSHSDLLNKLSQNPITVQYQLATPTIKTVDLTTVDQDGQPTKLKTFNDISYVEINADNLIPSVDVEIATKINETLATLDPQQLNISNTQNQLGQTIDEQTENTDATMMATTEIYEQTL